MKKILRIFVFIFLSTFISETCLRADFGIEVGSSLSFVGQNSEILDGATLFTAKAGLFYSFAITKSLFLQPGINFAMKGGRSYNVLSRAYDRVHLNYIEIPVLLCYSFLNEKFDVYLGPYVGFLISYTKNDDEIRWTWEENEIGNADVGFSNGARYHFIKWLFVEIQFNCGLAKIVRDPNPVSQSSPKAHRNRTLSLLLGLSF